MGKRLWGFKDVLLPLGLAVIPWREPVVRHICCGGSVTVTLVVLNPVVK